MRVLDEFGSIVELEDHNGTVQMLVDASKMLDDGIVTLSFDADGVCRLSQFFTNNMESENTND